MPDAAHSDSVISAEIGGIGAVTVALLALVLVAAGRRVAHGRMVLRPTARESIVGRNSGALVVPGMILLGWIGVLIVFVVLR